MAQELPGSYESILAKEGKLQASTEEKIMVLNKQLQPIINKFSTSHPDISMGYYDLSLKNMVAIGPSYTKENLVSIPDNHFSFKYMKTEWVEVVNHPTSIGSENKPTLGVVYPLFSDGKLIGHAWTDVKTEFIVAEVQNTRERWLLVALGLLCVGILSIHYITNRIRKALKLFAEIIVNDAR